MTNELVHCVLLNEKGDKCLFNKKQNTTLGNYIIHGKTDIYHY